ncbi:hypothetical protein MYX35_05920 [Borreliella burgdorferi]|nr:hypothetical protein [Borreliella burgdorferi]MDK7383984.1 hypothetical protein [Borreliella burgdorferi]
MLSKAVGKIENAAKAMDIFSKIANFIFYSDIKRVYYDLEVSSFKV